MEDLVGLTLLILRYFLQNLRIIFLIKQQQSLQWQIQEQQFNIIPSKILDGSSCGEFGGLCGSQAEFDFQLQESRRETAEIQDQSIEHHFVIEE
jgi:hypothetical protein